MLERRITYRRKSSYRTRGNNFRPVKTPGGKLVMHLLKKKGKDPKMQGIKVARPADKRRMSVCGKRVTRAYGGNLTGAEVKDRIMRAFLIDEFKYFKMMSKVTDGKKDKKKKKSADKKAKAAAKK
jgi:large subunit ribosomal protein L34e